MSTPPSSACSGLIYSGVPTKPRDRRVQRVLGERLTYGLGDAEVDDFWHGAVILHRHEDVGRFQISVDDSFLMRMLHAFTDLQEEFEPLRIVRRSRSQ